MPSVWPWVILPISIAGAVISTMLPGSVPWTSESVPRVRANARWNQLIVASVVAAYIYFKVIITMFFGEPAPGVEVVRPSAFTLVPLLGGAVATLYLGLFPGQLLDLMTAVGTFLR